MKKKGFLLFYLFVTLNILSQQKIALKGIILDQDNLPVPYASIGIISKNIGTTSTEEGTFNFIVTNKEINDNLEISSIGYQTFKIVVNDFLSQKNKTYMLFKKDKFYLEKPNFDDYKIIDFTKNLKFSRYELISKTGKKINVLMRWKNGNGIANPAFQIKNIKCRKMVKDKEVQ